MNQMDYQGYRLKHNHSQTCSAGKWREEDTQCEVRYVHQGRVTTTFVSIGFFEASGWEPVPEPTPPIEDRLRSLAVSADFSAGDVSVSQAALGQAVLGDIAREAADTIERLRRTERCDETRTVGRLR